ncbi:MAG: hypothetical protein ACR5LF_11410 [Symbiopectobacterium sp.]
MAHRRWRTAREGGRNTLRTHAIDAQVVIFSANVVTVDAQLHALIVIKPVPYLGQHIVSAGIHGITLGVIHADGPSIAIKIKPLIFISQRHHIIEFIHSTIDAVSGFIAGRFASDFLCRQSGLHGNMLIERSVFTATDDQFNNAAVAPKYAAVAPKSFVALAQ